MSYRFCLPASFTFVLASLVGCGETSIAGAGGGNASGGGGGAVTGDVGGESGSGGHGGHGEDGPPKRGPFGGVVMLDVGIDEGKAVAYAEATFAGDLTPDNSSQPWPVHMPKDECFASAGHVDGWEPPFPVVESYTLLKAGPAVTLTSPSAEIQLTDPQSQGWYVSSAGTYVEPGTEFAISLEGGHDLEAQTFDEKLLVPQAIELSQPNGPLTIPSGGDAEFEWTAGEDRVIEIRLLSADIEGPGVVCRAVDDGSFSIPASFLESIPETGGYNISIYSLRTQLIDGREVDLAARTVVFDDYAKQ